MRVGEGTQDESNGKGEDGWMMDERSAYASGTKRVAQKAVCKRVFKTLMLCFTAGLHRKRVERGLVLSDATLV
jgi:hypothetical protein